MRLFVLAALLPACSHKSTDEGSTGADGDADTDADTDTDTDADADTDTDTDTDADTDTDTVTGTGDTATPTTSLHPPLAKDQLLSSLDTSFAGSSSFDDLGAALGLADLDGDGRPEVIAGAYSDLGATDGGAVFAFAAPPTGVTPGTSATATFQSTIPADYAYLPSAPGDLDGDGVPDLLVGAPGDSAAGYSFGAAYLVSGPLTGTIDQSYAFATFYGGSEGALVGVNPFANAGDLDGDGQNDLMIDAYGADGGIFQSGAIYVYPGPITAGEYALANAPTILEGTSTGDRAGYEAYGQDWDGDGLNDVILGAFGEDGIGTDRGAARVVLSPLASVVDVADSDLVVVGDNDGDQSGVALANAGDLNGDGVADLAVGANYANGAANDGGAVGIVLGGTLGATAIAASPILLFGDDGGGLFGSAVAGPGDLDGDGRDDLAVGAFLTDIGTRSDAGAAFLFLAPGPGIINSTSCDARLTGDLAEWYGGSSFASGGDLDGDGWPDLIVGALQADVLQTGGGGAFVVWGGTL